jgi:predicted Zn-dependent protease
MRSLLWLPLTMVALASLKGETTAFNLAVDRANQAINAEKFSAAEKRIDAVAKADPKAAEGPNLRGVLRMREGRYGDASSQFNEALVRNPKYYPAKFNLAEVALLKGEAWEALRRFQELQVVDPESEVLQFKIALCYVLVGEDARATETASLIRFPGNTPAYYYARAAGWMKKEDWPRVEHYLESAHKYYDDRQCVYFESSLRAVGLHSARRKPTGVR